MDPSPRVGLGLFPAVFRELWTPAHPFLTVRDARHAAEAQECSAVTDQAAPLLCKFLPACFQAQSFFILNLVVELDLVLNTPVVYNL